MAFRNAGFWGSVAAVSAAAAVVVGYLLGGARVVWAVSAVEVVLVMAYVARRFRPRLHPPASDGGGTDHCERCRRARERLEVRDGRHATDRVGRPFARERS
ncbi:hypothetical protein [Kitasatospora camelliae]|uniref:Uncharacterized protein n=1 Tax=Kitasatospora camelliae TaxID=3156397 RepID=A0AAU8JXR9_9ACTN